MPTEVNEARREVGRREVAAVAVAAICLALVTSWPLPARLTDHVPYALSDPVLITWQMAWLGHALRSDPSGIFQTNIFSPEPDTLAYTDSLLALAPFSIVGTSPEAALVRHGLLWIMAYALAGLGAYLLARELGARIPPAAVAGIVYAYAPFRLSHGYHLHILWSGGIPLALFLLLRGYRRTRPWEVVAGWAVATWQLCVGWNLGLPFAYLLGFLVLYGVAFLWRAGTLRTLERSIAVATLAGILLFVATGWVISRPYQRVADREPDARRPSYVVDHFSPPLVSFFVPPKESRLWGWAQTGVREELPDPIEQSLFPGITTMALAGVGAVAGRRARSLRVGLIVAAGTFAVLALGMHERGFGRWYPYRLLYELAPGFQGLRVPGRLVTFASLALALLASFGAERLSKEGRRRLLVVALGAGVLLEGIGTPIPLVKLPAAPKGIEATGDRLQLHLPLNGGYPSETLYMLWTIGRFPPIVNGYSGYFPIRFRRLEQSVQGFPDRRSVEALQTYGVRTVVFHPELARGSRFEAVEARSVEGLPLTKRAVGDLILYEIGETRP